MSQAHPEPVTQESGGASSVTVLAGPTAVGKGTVSTFVRDHYRQVWLSVSATTRHPRPGEIDGVHYYFVDDAEFDRLVQAGDMLEWAVVHNSYRYGTPRQKVLDAVAQGRKVLLEIDLQGARQVRSSMPEAQFVFLAPPTWDDLVLRLTGRGTETAEEQRVRLETAKIELAAESEFDHTVVNDRVEAAAAALVELMGLDPTPGAS
ncbi:guanylate kinase [Kocuria sp.]|uniref:guanylate kinase n=1 Tax=Kocuria sp. TaxID=1871328 RepID=UPI0026E0DD99|nr:guanylate kinase [Kocuria sp.]MDO5617670.1 guanylate kinase [Kocuria sp.]